MLRKIKKLVPRPLIKLYHLTLAVVALLRYGNPSQERTVIGVTGTDGKTTTSYLIYQMLNQAGLPATLVTSVGAIFYGKEDETLATGLHATTPGPFLMQKILADARDSGSQYVVLETTSHGLEQFRVFGVNYTIGVVTNVTHEHLDYHGTWENYLAAKAKLLKNVEYSILNKDDGSFGPMVERASGEIISYSLEDDADLTGHITEMHPAGTRFEVEGLGALDMPMLGEYNVHNALAAIAAARAAGVDDVHIRAALEAAKSPPGRLESIDEGQPFTVYVDFAHTSNSLDEVLRLLHHVRGEGRVIAVFGCAGERDPFKRYPMGASSGRYADITVITAEDPRTEDLEQIMDEIARGVEDEGGVLNETYFRVGDREEAIRFAIQEVAQPGDIVVTTGKAQEASMCYGTTEYPWDEFAAVRKALRGLQKPVTE